MIDVILVMTVSGLKPLAYVSPTIGGTLIRINTQVLLMFDLHGSVDHEADQFQQEIQALRCNLIE